MNQGALRALEFDRIVAVVAGLAVTPTGEDRLAALQPMLDESRVIAAQRATTEGTRFLADHPGFPLRAPSDLHTIVDALNVEGRALEPFRLLSLAEYLESIEQTRSAVQRVRPSYPILAGLVESVASFKGEVADVRRRIEPSGEVADHASPTLAGIRERLRRQKARLRTTLDSFLRGRDTSKYLQDQVVTDRNGRYVLIVRAEHRGAIPGIVHGGSTSGASLFVEPLETVEINNEIVALEEQEGEEVRRILLELTDQFRDRPADLYRTLDVATDLDVIQARARFSLLTESVEPAIAADGTFELRAARHPLLMRRVQERLRGGDRGSAIGDREDTEESSRVGESRPPFPVPPSLIPDNPVPVDVLLTPPVHVLVITGPNTGGKTVALKTAGLLAAMAQAGLHIPVDTHSRLPVFKSLFADIGDEQSISASLSTFSGHIRNVVSMDRSLTLPALVLLDEVGAGTDPVEGGALGTAVIDHFRRRGSHLIATTHYDSLKSYASTTDSVASAAFGFDPESFAPTYRLIYGSPGRSLAIEIAKRLGLPESVIAAARENLTEPEKQLAEHLARVDSDLRTLEDERRQVTRERIEMAEADRRLRSREDSVREREAALRKRLDARLDEHLRSARREIDAVIEGLKARATELSNQAAVRLKSGNTMRAAGVSTGDVGAARADARAALDAIGASGARETGRASGASGAGEDGQGLSPTTAPAPGSRVTVGSMGLEGIVVDVRGNRAEVDVRGKRLRAALRDLRVIAGAAPRDPAFAPGSGAAERGPAVRVHLQPRQGSLSEINVIGCTVDEAVSRVEKFLDESMASDQQVIRIIHGHGTGQLRRGLAAFLKEHPLVARFDAAPQDQGGGGATMVELKD